MNPDFGWPVGGLFFLPFQLQCPLARLGMRCPTCGLGHSILEAFSGHWQNSLRLHFLGLPFLVLIFTGLILFFIHPQLLKQLWDRGEGLLLQYRKTSYLLIGAYAAWGFLRK